MKWIVSVFLVNIYRYLISPGLHLFFGAGSGCRFEPSCSQYFQEAIQTHGTLKGISLGVRRISRCHPWGGAGRDSVPPKR